VAIAGLSTYPGSKVICFEPVKNTFDILTQNLKPYGNRALLFNMALGSENREGEINITTLDGADSILPQSVFHRNINPQVRETGKEKIAIVTLDDISKQFPDKNIDIMKSDVEGYERNVLNGGTGFIRSNVDTIIIEVSLQRDESWASQSIVDIFAKLRDLGFSLINIFDVYQDNDADMMLSQIDCVFRKASKMKVPREVPLQGFNRKDHNPISIKAG